MAQDRNGTPLFPGDKVLFVGGAATSFKEEAIYDKNDPNKIYVVGENAQHDFNMVQIVGGTGGYDNKGMFYSFVFEKVEEKAPEVVYEVDYEVRVSLVTKGRPTADPAALLKKLQDEGGEILSFTVRKAP